jgi:hypothetical protein
MELRQKQELEIENQSVKNSDESQRPIPDWVWYQKQGTKLKITPRCPFASAKLCPRHFCTLALFGKHSVVENMSREEIAKLEEQLDRSPLFSKDFQPQPVVTLSRDNGLVSGWKDCCPEVVFDAYKVFATAGSFMDKEDTRLRRIQLKNENVSEDDWRWHFFLLSPAHFSECREFSISSHTAARSKQRGDRREARNISPKERWEIFARDNFTCRYCGRKPPEVALTVDHVRPVDADGTKEPENLVTACEDCNSGKSNRPPPKI